MGEFLIVVLVIILEFAYKDRGKLIIISENAVYWTRFKPRNFWYPGKFINNSATGLPITLFRSVSYIAKAIISKPPPRLSVSFRLELSSNTVKYLGVCVGQWAP